MNKARMESDYLTATMKEHFKQFKTKRNSLLPPKD